MALGMLVMRWSDPSAGQFAPGMFRAIGRLDIAQVNLPVGLLIWVMTVPMLLKVDFGALAQLRRHWRGTGVTLFVNWAVKPFSMALLAWLFTCRRGSARCLRRRSRSCRKPRKPYPYRRRLARGSTQRLSMYRCRVLQQTLAAHSR